MTDFILERFQGLAAAIQWLLGIDCLEQARYVGIAAFVAWCACDVAKRFWLGVGIGALLILSCAFGDVEEDEAIRADAARGLRNRRRCNRCQLANSWVWAICFFIDVILAAYKIRGWPWPAISFALTCRYFLRCCDPHPPMANALKRLAALLRAGLLQGTAGPAVLCPALSPREPGSR